eukprot:TRINITY_DN28854_c0_g1_i1.p4 TRINITY_DN28854_c0_g1~~TRINITY_DN28854_c0_g1_i1.p4  ORF type:complete len:119 (+),score=18.69 TRINITY_DN28854_c0_g1_i1:65-421(+)
MECLVCSEVVQLPARYEAACTKRCGRVCHLQCAQRWATSSDASDSAAGGMRMIDCPCGKGVFAPHCLLCGLEIVPPTPCVPTCPAPCLQSVAHRECLEAVRVFRAGRNCGLCGNAWAL